MLIFSFFLPRLSAHWFVLPPPVANHGRRQLAAGMQEKSARQQPTSALPVPSAAPPWRAASCRRSRGSRAGAASARAARISAAGRGWAAVAVRVGTLRAAGLVGERRAAPALAVAAGARWPLPVLPPLLSKVLLLCGDCAGRRWRSPDGRAPVGRLGQELRHVGGGLGGVHLAGLLLWSVYGRAQHLHAAPVGGRKCIAGWQQGCATALQRLTQPGRHAGRVENLRAAADCFSQAPSWLKAACVGSGQETRCGCVY